MARPKKIEIDSTMFEGFTAAQLKDEIVKNVRQIKKNTADLKDFRGSINDLNTELESRNTAALELLDELKLTALAG